MSKNEAFQAVNLTDKSNISIKTVVSKFRKIKTKLMSLRIMGYYQGILIHLNTPGDSHFRHYFIFDVIANLIPIFEKLRISY